LTISTAYGGTPVAAPFAPIGTLLATAKDAKSPKGPVTARIDAYNYSYVQDQEKGKEEPDPNFLQHNRAAVAERSKLNSTMKEELANLNQTVSQHTGAVHNYSSQTFNSSVLAVEKMRNLLLRDIKAGHRPGGVLFSYDPSGTFHHSAASAVLALEAPEPGTSLMRGAVDSWGGTSTRGCSARTLRREFDLD
jgi:hypothetical protein